MSEMNVDRTSGVRPLDMTLPAADLFDLAIAGAKSFDRHLQQAQTPPPIPSGYDRPRVPEATIEAPSRPSSPDVRPAADQPRYDNRRDDATSSPDALPKNSVTEAPASEDSSLHERDAVERPESDTQGDESAATDETTSAVQDEEADGRDHSDPTQADDETEASSDEAVVEVDADKVNLDEAVVELVADKVNLDEGVVELVAHLGDLDETNDEEAAESGAQAADHDKLAGKLADKPAEDVAGKAERDLAGQQVSTDGNSPQDDSGDSPSKTTARHAVGNEKQQADAVATQELAVDEEVSTQEKPPENPAGRQAAVVDAKAEVADQDTALKTGNSVTQATQKTSQQTERTEKEETVATTEVSTDSAEDDQAIVRETTSVDPQAKPDDTSRRPTRRAQRKTSAVKQKKAVESEPSNQPSAAQGDPKRLPTELQPPTTTRPVGATDLAADIGDAAPKPTANNQNNNQNNQSDVSARVSTDRSNRSAAASRPEANEESRPIDQARFVRRVARAFRTMSDRVDSVRLRLNPPELGALRLEITVRNGVMTARMEAETVTARNLLLDNLPALRERLAEQDIKIDRFDVDLMDRSSGGLRQQSADDANSDGSGGRGPSRSGTETQSDSDTGSERVAVNRPGEGSQLNVVV